MQDGAELTARTATRTLLVALLTLLTLRVGAIFLSGTELYADEAQYWRWSRSYEWGYYSKPPMIAWLIGAATAVFGNAEWAIRIPAPFLHTIAAAALFGLGRDMYSPRIGLLAALGYALMPGIILSSAVLSTDGVLLPFWSIGLYLLWRLRSSAHAGWVTAIGLGLCMGAGFLSKYAMLYFFIGLGITALIDPPTRRALISMKGLSAIAVAALLIAPHMMWNAANDFKTVGHTVDNANLGGDLINPENFIKFLGDQMAVFGPISFLALLGGLWAFLLRPGERQRDPRDHWLLAFILPVILIIAGQAVLSRAHANWAATAYPAASVLVAAWLVRAHSNRWLWMAIAAICFFAFLAAPDISLLLRLALGLGFAGTVLAVGLASGWRPVGLAWSSIGLHTAIATLMATLLALPVSLTTTLGLDNAFKRVRGWEVSALAVAEQARAIEATAILVDEREVWHGLDYYMRDMETPPLIAWRRNAGPKSFSESVAMTDDIDDKVLIVSVRPNMRPRMRGDFEAFHVIGDQSIELGYRSNGCQITRHFVFYEASGYDEQPRTQEWEDAFDGLSERPNPPCPQSVD